jgi:hypothetical protein
MGKHQPLVAKWQTTRSAKSDLTQNQTGSSTKSTPRCRLQLAIPKVKRIAQLIKNTPTLKSAKKKPRPNTKRKGIQQNRTRRCSLPLAPLTKRERSWPGTCDNALCKDQNNTRRTVEKDPRKVSPEGALAPIKVKQNNTAG